MDFSLTEEQAMLRDSIDKFVRDNCDVETHRRVIKGEKGFDPGTWDQFAELGWLCMPFSEEQGGFGGGAVDLMVMTEAMGKGLLRVPFLSTAVTCGGFLQQAGDDAQQDRYIGDIIGGQAQWAFAFAEVDSGYDMARVSCRAEAVDAGFRLDGGKISVLNGHCANFLIVSALTVEGLSLFIVDTSLEGVRRKEFTAVDGSRGAHVEFNGVLLEAGQMLGEAGKAVSYIEDVLAKSIVAMGGEALGSMQVLLQTTVEYTKTREQFGQPIGKFQALQHRMADMYLKVEETRALLFNAAILLDEGSAEAMQACAALKVKIAEAGRLVSQEAVQLHGGIGMTDELDVGHHFKRLHLLGMLYGDEDYYLEKYMQLAG
ncbi:acyl-CoA dehydrogenase family protein [Biformimicrobium ophioploci]|uniref:Pimeloyl-CoA dehydrogenase small subunit n=1 Tax=Biformimicrobium ophioploci TaxID=3036711 RepID=A0ABQ6M224_9GAMM|nr:acyl-CoA dehydrogenase [Microbulbifer sp. NKW57]GMG88405.1 pimeloyl-CoA dehydrogenase small subunit [Microbulbifer sp. NKW57]